MDVALKAVVVDVDQTTIDVVGSMLHHHRNILSHGAADERSAKRLFSEFCPDLILIAHTRPLMDAVQLTRKLRFSDLSSRKTPVIMLATKPTLQEIAAARNAGVHEVLRKPFTARDLLARVDVVLGGKREWIEAVAYVGPDRRRFNSADYSGVQKRLDDGVTKSSDAARIDQALKIIASAIKAMDTEPRQAQRALRAQVDEIEATALSSAHLPLLRMVRLLRADLDAAIGEDVFDGRRIAASSLNVLLATRPGAQRG